MFRLTLLVCLVVLAGCRPADEVRTYTAPKSKDIQPPVAATGEDTDRLLGVLIPAADGQLYSVKLSGPIAAVSAEADRFRTFAETIRVTADPTKPLTYTAPAGWKPGRERQMRLATFEIGSGPKPLEVAVFPPFGGTLLANVNRWREQVGAKPVADAELSTAATELKLGDSKAYYVDARGTGGAGGMTPPFMKK